MTDALTHADHHDHDHHAHEHEHAHEHTHGAVIGHARDPHDYEEMAFESFGVRIRVAAPPHVLPRLEQILPPGWQRHEPAEDDARFQMRTHNRAVYRVESPGRSVSGSSDLQIALEVLDTRLREYIALHAPDRVFVHAGVVAYNGRAIVLPGTSFSGKTTLVAELVRAGATYYSDEFAVLDADGLVHPYPKPLSVRSDGPAQVDHPVAALGGSAGEEAVPIGLVAIVQYAPGASWAPKQLSPGEAVLGVLANTVPAQERPQESLSAVKQALEGVVVLEGARGEASEVVAALLDAVR